MPLPALLLGLLAFLPQQEAAVHSAPTGLEWMIYASILVPAVLLSVLIYAGTKRTV